MSIRSIGLSDLSFFCMKRERKVKAQKNEGRRTTQEKGGVKTILSPLQKGNRRTIAQNKTTL